MDCDFDQITNNIDVSTPFVYPEDNTQAFEDAAEAMANAKVNEFLTRLAIIVLTARNPVLTLVSLFHATGVNLSFIFNCSNSETDLAKKLAVPKQTFSLEVKRIREQLQITHSSTIMSGMTPEAYKNNYRKHKT